MKREKKNFFFLTQCNISYKSSDNSEKTKKEFPNVSTKSWNANRKNTSHLLGTLWNSAIYPSSMITFYSIENFSFKRCCVNSLVKGHSLREAIRDFESYYKNNARLSASLA